MVAKAYPCEIKHCRNEAKTYRDFKNSKIHNFCAAHKKSYEALHGDVLVPVMRKDQNIDYGKH